MPAPVLHLYCFDAERPIYILKRYAYLQPYHPAAQDWLPTEAKQG